MVRESKRRKYVAIEYVESLIMSGIPSNEIAMQLNNLPVREPEPEPPKGGISIRDAAKKYRKELHVTSPTISRWVKHGLISVVLRTKHKKYINEAQFVEVAKKYQQDPGRGKRTVFEN